MKEPEKIRRAVDEKRWPVYGKLHGDYHSDALKNTDAELRQQDVEMRRSLVDCCRRQGLAVIGYSGRDASIMAALEEALDEGRGFPGGLFWFKRGQDTPYSAVTALIARARALGIDAHLVEANPSTNSSLIFSAFSHRRQTSSPASPEPLGRGSRRPSRGRARGPYQPFE